MNKTIEVYEEFFHKINYAVVAMNNDRVRDAVKIICEWSYAHRSGNGELSSNEIQERIETVIEKMKSF